MEKIKSSFIRGLWLAIVAGIIYSVLSWGWGLVIGAANLVGISPILVSILLPFVFVFVGIISQSRLIPWLSARFQSSVVRSLMRRFERDERDDPDDPDSWTGQEVAVAVGEGCYHNGNIPAIQKHGFVTATYVENGIHFVSVQFIYPPTGTGERSEVRTDSCKIRLTGRSSAGHMAMVTSLGKVRIKATPPTAKMKPHVVNSLPKQGSAQDCVKAPAAKVPCKTEEYKSPDIKSLKMNRF